MDLHSGVVLTKCPQDTLIITYTVSLDRHDLSHIKHISKVCLFAFLGDNGKSDPYTAEANSFLANRKEVALSWKPRLSYSECRFLHTFDFPIEEPWSLERDLGTTSGDTWESLREKVSEKSRQSI